MILEKKTAIVTGGGSGIGRMIIHGEKVEAIDD